MKTFIKMLKDDAGASAAEYALILAIVVVDSCMLPRELVESAKAQASKLTGIPADNILISATHTHSAPSTMEMCLGTRKDEAYTAQMIPQVAAAIVQAHAALAPAKAGWTQVDAHAFTNCRPPRCQATCFRMATRCVPAMVSHPRT